MRRLDHSMIFVLIAGTYTPVCLLALHGSLAHTILIVVWAGALGGVVFKLLWIDAPKWLLALVYVALGLGRGGRLRRAARRRRLAGRRRPRRRRRCSTRWAPSSTRRGRPNPWPKMFGYHEVFHALVIAAAAMHYAVIAFAVLPRG